MALDIYELAIRFKSEGFAAVSRDMDALDKKGKGLAKAFTALKASLVVGAVGGFIRMIAVESIEAQKQTAQLNAVLKSTGGIAGVTAPEIEKIAGALQKTTVFSDEAVKSAASLLLTFTNIRGEIFKNTLPVLLDMSQALGQDLKSSAIQVGKALNDPIEGVSALQRVGVSFTESQKEVIKKLIETGQMAKAQQLILAELTTEFGGSAAAAKNTLGGALAGLKNSWGELLEMSTDSSAGIVGAINRLSKDLDDNKEKWHKWAGMLLDDSGGPFAALNKVMAAMNRVGDWLHNNPTAGGGRGGGSGGGRDTPTGPLTMSPVVVMAGKSTSRSGGSGGGGKAGREKSIDLPSGQAVDINFGGLRQFEPQEPEFDWTNSAESKRLEELFAANDRLAKAFDEAAELAAAEAERAAKELQGRLTSILGDAVYNAFSAAFNGEGLGGIFKAFGKTILSGLGGIFVEMGTKMVAASALMETFQKAITAFLPGGGIVAGLALIALGSAMGALGGGRGAAGSPSRGVSGAGSFGGSDDITRYKFVNRDGSIVGGLKPIQPVHFTVIGTNDPAAQRAIGEIVEKHSRRAA